MATIQENIEAMAKMVSGLKRTTHLNETTLMRIVDLNFAVAREEQQGRTFGQRTPVDEEFPFDMNDLPTDEEIAAAAQEPTEPVDPEPMDNVIQFPGTNLGAE